MGDCRAELLRLPSDDDGKPWIRSRVSRYTTGTGWTAIGSVANGWERWMWRRIDRRDGRELWLFCPKEYGMDCSYVIESFDELRTLHMSEPIYVSSQLEPIIYREPPSETGGLGRDSYSGYPLNGPTERLPCSAAQVWLSGCAGAEQHCRAALRLRQAVSLHHSRFGITSTTLGVRTISVASYFAT